MKFEQKGPINVLSMQTLKKATKTLLVATVVASQVFTVLPTGSFAAESTNTGTTEAPSADSVAQKIAPVKTVMALKSGVTESRTQVSTFAAFKAAAESGTYNVIELTGDFQFTSNVTINSNMRIEGNGHTVSVASYQILMKSTSIIDLQDTVLTNAGSLAIFAGYDGYATPTLNILDNVQVRGFVMGGSGNLSMSVDGSNNRFISAQSKAIDVNKLEIKNGARIEQLEALSTAITIRSTGSASIGDNAYVNMTSNNGYAFDAWYSSLVVGTNAVIKSSSKYGTLRASSLVIKDGADVTLSSGDSGYGIYTTGSITIGNNVKLNATGTGTAVYAYNTGAAINVGKNADINITSDNGHGFYTNGKITFGDGSSLHLKTQYTAIYALGSGGVQFGTVSATPKPISDQVTIDLNSSIEYGIYSYGPAIFGDNTKLTVKSYYATIYAAGSSLIDIGAHTDAVLSSSSDRSIVAGGLKIGDGSNVDVKAYSNGIEMTDLNGDGLTTGSNVSLKVNSSVRSGIITYKTATFGDNNTLEFVGLGNSGIATYYGSAVNVGKNSSIYLNGQYGAYQEGTSAAFNVGQGTSTKIDASQAGILTAGGATFAEDTKTNIRAASGYSNYPAIKANSTVTFNQNSMIYAETLSNTSTSVFDLSGSPSSKLVLNSPKFIDFRQNNKTASGHIVRGYGNDSEAYRSRVEMNNMAKVYAWNQDADWSKTASGEWSDVDNAKIPLTYQAGTKYVSYYGGVATGQNIDGFQIFDYSRVSTEGSSSIDRPVVSPIYEGAKTVSGTGVVGDDIVVTFPDGKTAKATVDADGKWTANVPAGTNLVKDQSVQTYQTNGVNDSVKVTTKVIADTTVPATPTVSPIKAGDTTINGEAVPGNTVTVKLPDGTTATGVADADGKFAITIPAQKADAVIDVTQAGKNGLPSEAKSVIVKSNEKPVITASDKTLKIGDTFNPLTGVTATDKEDGNLTSGITVVTNTVDTTKAGTYTVKYSVTDADNNTTTKTITVTVNTNEKPVITATNKTINVGDTFSPLADVTATDKEDGDLTSSITVVTNTVDTTKAGTYSVKYSVTDADNNTTTKTITVTVVSVTAGKVVVTAPYYVGYDTTVKATVSGDATKVYLQVGDTKYTTVPVSGNFTYYAKDKITTTTQDAYIVALDSAGKELSRAKVTLKDGQLLVGTVTPKEFIVSADSYVTGTYTGSVTKVAISVNGTVYPAVAVTGSGALQYYAKDKITSKTDVVKMIGYNSEGTIIDTKDVSVAGPESLVGAITINPSNFAISTDSYVKGTFTGNVKTVALVVNGVESAKVGVVDGTTWQYYAKGKILAPTDVVSVKAYNAAGTLVDTKTLTVTQNPAGASTIVPATFKLKTDTNVKGTFTGSVKYVALKVGDTVYSKVAVVDGTNWQYYAKDKITDTTTAVSVIGYDSTGTQIATAPVTITPEGSSTITAGTYLLGANNVTGTYTGAVKYVAIKINDTTYSKVPVNADGSYQYYIKDKVASKDDVVTVLGYDSTGAVVAQDNVTIDPGVAPTMKADDFTIGTTRNITGTFTGGIKYVGIKVGDTTYSKVPVATDGTYTYYAKDKITDATAKVTVLGYDAVGLALEVEVAVN
ncbi:immunoglobulin-like domain-containing protein [Listeria rustica]|uniref:DUF5011 domain-containing protein n=1 Tax=Listeria rustica TaxID=2713503 RepID=A0A7W1T918_9LIST|nr:immunoglobulin-like domain-containing protein [Listeria rustica]MBA3927684.1 DUF5011 domain-containing protein [Listeria rustica]